MNRQTLSATRPTPPRHRSYQPSLTVLEDRVLLSTTAAIFTLDQANSSLTLSGTFAGATIQQQGTGSLTTQYTGTLVAQWDLTARTIQFISTGTAATALNSGTWQPNVNGGSGSAPANYGGRATILFITGYAAVRNLVATTSTANPVALSGSGPSYTFPSNQTLTITNGFADYSASGIGSGRSSLANNSATNTASAGTFQDLGSGNFRITAPINITINQTVGGQQAVLHIIGTIVGNAVMPTSFAVTGFPNPDTAGNAGSVTVTAKAANGSTATGYLGTVHFSSSDVQAGLPANYTFTAADNGVHTFSNVVLKTAGSESITATDTANSSIVGSQTVTVNPAAASTLIVGGFPSPITAGTPGNVTVTAKDPYGNTATGYTGTVHFSSSDPQAALPGNSTLTNGTGSFSATLNTPGTQSLTATDTVNSGITGTQAGIVVNPGITVDHFAVVTDAANPDIAGSVFDVTVTAQDANGNTVTGYTGTIAFSSADPYGASLPANYTFQPSDQGSVTFFGATALYTAGTWDVTATDTSSGAAGSALINVQAAPAVALAVIAPGTASSGVAFDVTVVAQDPYGNTDTNYQGTVTWATSDPDPGVVLPADYTFQPSDQGQVTFSGGVTLITPGDQQLVAFDTSNNSITGGADVFVNSPSTANGGLSRVSLGTPGQTPVFSTPAQSAAGSTSRTSAALDQYFTLTESGQGWSSLSHKPDAALGFVLDAGTSLGSAEVLTADPLTA